MAFLLKSARFIYTAVRFTGKRDFSTERRIVLLQWPRVVNLNAPSARTAVSVTAEANITQNEPDKVESLIYHLNRDMKYKNVLTKEIEDVVNAIKQRGELKDAQLTLLLRCCSESAFMATNHERIALAENVWTTAEKFGVVFNINHYNSLLVVFLNNDHKFNVQEFFDILNNKNIEPNFMTYRLALKAYCQTGDIEGASKILAKLKDLNYVLKEDDFSSLIQGHCEIGDFEKAKELLDVMRSKDLTPTSKSYIKLLLGYAKHGKIEELNNLLDKLNNDKIVIGNSDLLEIIYTLSVNNQESHIDSFIERLNEDGGSGIKSAKIIQKLLHRRKDSLALNVFERTLSPGLPMDGILSRAKFIIKHFVMYRSPSEVLQICKHLDNKGWSNAALSYALREVLLNKQEISCLNFLNTMKKEGLEIRNHYYWPVIIKASKRGIPWLRDVLQKLPRSAFFNSYETTYKVIFPTFVFRSIADYDFLCSLGINKRLLNYCFFEKHLLQRNLEKAESRITRQQVTTKRWKHTVNCLLTAFTHEQNDHQNFLSILQGFAHDFYYVRSFLQSNVDDLEDQEIHEEAENIFDYALLSLTKRLKNEELFTKLLEGMLERKMGISPTTADNIASSFQSEKIRDLATKLASPEASFQYDINLLLNKMWKIPSGIFSSVSDSAKDLVLKPSMSGSSLAEAVTPETPTTDAMFFAVVLGHRGLLKDAFKIFTNLAGRKADTPDQNAIDLFRCFLLKQAGNSAKVVFDALEFGPKMGIPEQDLARILRQVQEGCNSGDAFHIYHERITRHHKISGCLALMIKAAKERNFAVIRRIKRVSADFLGEELLSTYHVIALASAGLVEMAKRMLARENVRLRHRVFYNHCEIFYPHSTAQVLENYLEVVKNVKNFDRGPLYKLLLRKYAEDKEIDKALGLCATIEKDDVPDFVVLKEVTAFKGDPTLQNLEKIINNFQTDMSASQGPFENSEPMVRQSSNREVVESTETVTKAASSGNVSTVLKLLRKKSMKDVKYVCTAFLENGKVEEFFQFLEDFAREGKFTSISNCFNINALLPVLKDDSKFEKYKALALRCLEEGYVTTPLISLFVTCVKIPSRLSVGEVLVQQYSAHFQNVPFLEVCEEAKTGGCEIEFYENFVKSENLKSAFPEYHHVMFNKLIKHHCKNDNLKDALQYLEMAVSNSAEKFIDKDIIHLLDEKLRKTGESFPHPELLSTSSANSTF